MTPIRVGFGMIIISALSLGGLSGGCSSDVQGPNRAPLAHAGTDRSLAMGQSALLDGSASSDPDGDGLDYRWELVHAPVGAGASVVIQDADAVQARIEPDVTGLWVVRLTVSDGFLDSVPDVVQVHMAGCRSASECDDQVDCTQDSCVEAVCQHEAQDGDCDNGIWCDGVEVCDPLDGCLQAPVDPCDDGFLCTQDICDEAGQICANSPDDSACADGLYCNGDELCDPLSGCQPGQGVTCDDGVACTIDACDETNDVCTVIIEDGRCDDGAFCNGAETCDAVLDCQPGSPVDCDDGLGCTLDSCDEQNNVCANTGDDLFCDDGLYCNGPEVCDGQAGCQRLAPPNCDDAIACTLDSCDEANDACLNAPDDAACDDGNECLVDSCLVGQGCQHLAGNEGGACTNGACSGTCAAGLCVPCACSTNADCDDGHACTADVCDANGNCVYTPDDGLCDDLAWCNGVETCGIGVGCQAGTPPDCADGVVCTDDACVEATDSCDHVVNDANCDNGLYCDGAETCDAVQGCQLGTAIGCDDGIACTNDSCDEAADACDNAPDHAACDNGDFCDGAELCDPVQGCQPGSDPCVDVIACTNDACDEALDTCSHLPDDGLCDDNRSCNGSETCDVVLGCQFGSWAADGIACDEGAEQDGDWCDSSCVLGVCNDGVAPVCDDGLVCNGSEICLSGSGCSTSSALADGSSCDEGLGTNGDACDSSCRSGVCDTQPANAGQACSDGIDCTGPDLCDGAGACAGVNDDEYCLGAGIGSLCRPQCFGGSGCGDPPGGLDLSCTPRPVDLGRAVTAQCDVDLGESGQGACLSCAAKLGHVQLDYTDFDGVGACDPNGWGLVYGAACYDTYNNCVPGTADRACCADLTSTCVDVGGGDYLMLTNRATNCGGGVEEWRLQKVFDFSDLSDLRLCFDLSDNNANDNQVVAVWVEDLDSPGPLEIYCQHDGPRDDVNDVAFLQCVDLPAGLNGRARVEIMFVAHSENDNRVMAIDNISLSGWTAACAADVVSLVIEDFDGCADPLPDPFGAWTVGGTILCNSSDFNCFDGSDRAIADATTGSIERRVDASAFDADVELCWHFGDKGNDANKTLLVEYDAGSGFQPAWGYTGNQGPNNGCLQVCINLSGLDPAVARNPNLGLRFSLDSSSEELVIDHILLRGARNCAAGADLTLGPMSDNGDGSYSFNAVDALGDQLDADILCSWDSPPAGSEVEGGQVVGYRNRVIDSAFRRRLDFDNSAQGQDLLGFPVLVKLDVAWFDYGHAQADGSDLVFMDENMGTLLPHEIEQWDPAGTSILWVRVPTIDAGTVDDHIWMLYGGRGGAVPEDPVAIWNGYRAVWHLNELVADEGGGGSHADATGNGNTGAQSGNDDLATFLGRGQTFDGNNDRIQVPQAGLQIGGQALTIGLWARATGMGDSSYPHILGAGSDGRHWQIFHRWDREWVGRYRIRDWYREAADWQSVSWDVWQWVVVRYDGSTLDLFLDGQLTDTNGEWGDLNPIDSQVWIGHNPGLDRPFQGDIEEVRIRASVLSDDWIYAQYLSMVDAFVTFSSEEPF